MRQSRCEVGVRWDLEGGHRWFGFDEVHRRLKQGFRIEALGEGGSLVTKLGEDATHVEVCNTGCTIVVRFASPQHGQSDSKGG